MICPNCGATLPDTAQICFSCRMQFDNNFKRQQQIAQIRDAQQELQQINNTGNAIYIICIIINSLLLLFMLFAGFYIVAIVVFVILIFNIRALIRMNNRKAELEQIISAGRR